MQWNLRYLVSLVNLKWRALYHNHCRAAAKTMIFWVVLYRDQIILIFWTGIHRSVLTELEGENAFCCCFYSIHCRIIPTQHFYEKRRVLYDWDFRGYHLVMMEAFCFHIFARFPFLDLIVISTRCWCWSVITPAYILTQWNSVLGYDYMPI